MKLRVPIPNTLFRAGLLLMMIKVFSSFSNFVEISYSVDMAISLAACLFFVGAIVQKKYETRTWLSFFFVLVLSLFTSLRTGNLTILIAVTTCLAMCGENLDDTIRFLLFWEATYTAVKTVISVIMHTCGISMLTLVGNEMQYNFGFSHPNVFACIAANLFAMYLWLHFTSISVRQRVAICAITLILYILTGSRTAVIVAVFLLGAQLLIHSRKRIIRPLRAAAKFVVPLLSVLFLFLCRVYTSGHALVMLVDSLLSKRIKLGAYYWNRFGVSFFGQNVMNIQVKWDPFWRMTNATFDNIYTYLLISQMIWLIIVSVLFYKTAKAGDNKTSVFILAWALYGISETHVINPYLFFVLLLVSSLSDKNKGRRNVGKTE